MSRLIRSPSWPHKVLPSPSGAPPSVPEVIGACATCRAVVVPEVREGFNALHLVMLFLIGVLPGLIYLCMHVGSRTPVCPWDGTVLTPLGSLRGREILGAEWDQAVADALSLHAEREAQRAVKMRQDSRMSGALAAVLWGVILFFAAWIWLGTRPNNAEPTAQQEAAHAESVQAREAALAAKDGEVPRETITISADGTASAVPGGEPVMSVTAGEVYEIGEVRDGWTRLASAPVEAWVKTGEP